MTDELPRNHGKLILDATVAEQAIRYPTDLGLLNEARELSERIIDELHAIRHRTQKKKPRTYRERIPIEGKFGQGKYGYRLNDIRAKRADTAAAWINSIFLVMNLLILVRVFICLRNLAAKIALWVTKKSIPRKTGFAHVCQFISNQNFYLAANN